MCWKKLFDRIQQIELDLDPNRTGKVFNVLGDVFPANQLERMVRDMYARNLTEAIIKDRIVEQVDTDRMRAITESTLEGLAKRELNLSAIVGKSEEAKERRLVPEVIEDFFVQAAPYAGITPKPSVKKHTSTVWGDCLEHSCRMARTSSLDSVGLVGNIDASYSTRIS